MLERLEAAGAKPMELNWMKVKLRSRASDETRGQSAGGGTGAVAVGTDDVAARAAAAKDKAAADVNDEAAATAAAAPTALNAHGSGGGEDVPQRGKCDVATFLGNISVRFSVSELFLLPLRDVGVTCARTLDLFAGIDEPFATAQVDSFKAAPLQKLLLVKALQERGGQKPVLPPPPRVPPPALLPRVPPTTTQEPDAGPDEADRYCKKFDDAPNHRRSRQSSQTHLHRLPGHRHRDDHERRSSDRRSSDSDSDSDAPSRARRSRSKDRGSTHRIAGSLVAKQSATAARTMKIKRLLHRSRKMVVVEARLDRVASPTCPPTGPAAAAATATEAAPNEADQRSASLIAGALVFREVKEAAAAAATGRTKVGALHRTTNVVSLKFLPGTLTRPSTRTIASAFSLCSRNSEIRTCNTITIKR